MKKEITIPVPEFFLTEEQKEKDLVFAISLIDCHNFTDDTSPGNMVKPSQTLLKRTLKDKADIELLENVMAGNEIDLAAEIMAEYQGNVRFDIVKVEKISPMKKEISVMVNDDKKQTFVFEVCLTDYHNYQNDSRIGNFVVPSKTLLKKTLKDQNKLQKLEKAMIANEVEFAGLVLKEFKPQVNFTIKKSTTVSSN
ncbi:putative phage tail assembly chaperone [Lentisphaerota bacterium WC36G]|nr:putative phage tail assembly chaperone [Lentisphaerae bacterium WC36]